jgi:hypothetical protein
VANFHHDLKAIDQSIGQATAQLDGSHHVADAICTAVLSAVPSAYGSGGGPAPGRLDETS